MESCGHPGGGKEMVSGGGERKGSGSVHSNMGSLEKCSYQHVFLERSELCFKSAWHADKTASGNSTVSEFGGCKDLCEG